MEEILHAGEIMSHGRNSIEQEKWWRQNNMKIRWPMRGEGGGREGKMKSLRAEEEGTEEKEDIDELPPTRAHTT